MLSFSDTQALHLLAEEDPITHASCTRVQSIGYDGQTDKITIVCECGKELTLSNEDLDLIPDTQPFMRAMLPPI